MLSLVSIVVFALAGSTVAAPAEENKRCPFTICAEGINSCGVEWGTCYDSCTQHRPSPPGCPPTAAVLATTSTPKTITPHKPSITSTSTKKTIPCHTVCVDGVDDCGVPFQTCFPRCSTGQFPSKTPCTPSPGLPTILPPTSSHRTKKTTTKASTTTTTSASSRRYSSSVAVITDNSTFTPSSSSFLDGCSSLTVCADYITTCGTMLVPFGGCFSACTPWPTFTPPPCSVSGNGSPTRAVSVSATATTSQGY